jgi:hypothetical protein
VNTPSILAYEAARESAFLKEAVAPRLSEIEVQARLFNGEYGTRWRTTCGEEFEIVHFGEWNREAGPDFKNAVIEFADRGRLTGDIEVDFDIRDWERHRHAINPSFADVILHFFINTGDEVVFARDVIHRRIPQARLLIDKPDKPVESDAVERVEMVAALAMLDQAAEFRLRSKNASHAAAARLHGRENALFFSIATGLGYKNNTIPFMLAAQRCGLVRAKTRNGEAMLFGLAGFLHPRTFDDADDVTRTYLKPLWDRWWTVRDSFSRSVLPEGMWKLSGIRPSNHPHRRLGALGVIASRFDVLCTAVSENGVEGFRHIFEHLEHPYWSRHWNLSADPLEKNIALVGSDRVTDLMINALLPSMSLNEARSLLHTLRGPFASGRLRRASQWLVGTVEPKLIRTAWQQQGLLQLYSDFGAVAPADALARMRSIVP